MKSISQLAQKREYYNFSKKGGVRVRACPRVARGTRHARARG